MTEKIKNEIINLVKNYVPDSRTVYELENNTKIYKIFSKIGYRIRFGAYKMVLIPKNKEYDWVIKIPLNSNFNDDGCLSELKMYKKMIGMNLDCFFAYTEFLCKVGDVPVYVQEKVKPYFTYQPISFRAKRSVFDICQEISKETNEMVEDIKAMITILPTDWWNSAINVYGASKVKQLIQLICDGDVDILYTWGDLHEGNFGYRNLDGAPCILDFSEADY